MNKLNGFDGFVEWLYADGDLFMIACRIVVFIFILETASYFVSMISSITKGAK